MVCDGEGCTHMDCRFSQVRVAALRVWGAPLPHQPHTAGQEGGCFHVCCALCLLGSNMLGIKLETLFILFLQREEHEAEGFCCSCRRFLLQEWTELLGGRRTLGWAVLSPWMEGEEGGAGGLCSQGDGANTSPGGDGRVLLSASTAQTLQKPRQFSTRRLI